MLKEKVWNKILKHYNLVETAGYREDLHDAMYNLHERIVDLLSYSPIIVNKYELVDIYRKLDSALQDRDCHTYICKDCMEKALGRKIEKSDLIAENFPFNSEFEKTYL